MDVGGSTSSVKARKHGSNRPWLAGAAVVVFSLSGMSARAGLTLDASNKSAGDAALYGDSQILGMRSNSVNSAKESSKLQSYAQQNSPVAEGADGSSFGVLSEKTPLAVTQSGDESLFSNAVVPTDTVERGSGVYASGAAEKVIGTPPLLIPLPQAFWSGSAGLAGLGAAALLARCRRRARV